jgi:uncharacterized protein (DUF1697 family)
MITYIALLRGINVGGRNRLPMKELRALLEEIGLQRVRTYIQSGNVVLQSAERDTARLAGQIGGAIAGAYDFEPAVLVLPAQEFDAAVAGNPFPGALSEPKTLHLYFLSAEPPDPDLEALQEFKKEDEEYELRGTVFYLFAPSGIGRSKLAARVEKVLGVPATARNWRTVSKIMDLANQWTANSE